MGQAPRQIDGAKVLCFTPIDERHRPTDNCKQIVKGAVQRPASGLAICQYEGDDCYYLFGCGIAWDSVTDTCHQTMEEAKSQAEFEYVGVSATWQEHA
jgi:hypothetical protein